MPSAFGGHCEVWPGLAARPVKPPAQDRESRGGRGAAAGRAAGRGWVPPPAPLPPPASLSWGAAAQGRCQPTGSQAAKGQMSKCHELAEHRARDAGGQLGFVSIIQ